MKAYNKVFIFGNSLTLGFGTHGMASTDVDTDWFYHVSVGLKTGNPSVQIRRYPGGSWEEATSWDERLRALEDHFTPYLEPDADLILMQLGDNINSLERRETFREDAAETIRYLRLKCPDARIVWIYGWYGKDVNLSPLKEALAETDTELVDITELAPLPENCSFMGATYRGADGEMHIIDHDGVASHPNDIGMKKIAEIVLANIGEEPPVSVK